MVEQVSQLLGDHTIGIVFFILVPLILLATKQHQWNILWVIIINVFEIFSIQSIIPLTAFKVFGLLLIPWAIYHTPQFIKDPVARWILMWIGVLFTITFYFVVISPWPDTTGGRSTLDLGTARAIKQLGTLLGDWSIALYIGWHLKSSEQRHWMIKAVFIICFLDMAGPFLQRLLDFDFYHYFTGAPLFDHKTTDLIRPRGFNYEPRGAGQICAYALLLLAQMPFRWYFKSLYALTLLIAFYLIISIAGFALLILGITILTVIALGTKTPLLYNRSNLITILFLIITGSVGWTITQKVNLYQTYFWGFNLEKKSYVVDAQNWTGRFEPYDAAALNFLANNPQYLLFGVGAGQAALATSPYVLSQHRFIDEKGNRRIDALPHMGMVYQLITVGLIGLIIWGVAFWKGSMALWKQKDIFSLICFTLMLLLYLAQFRYLFPLIWGLGISASLRKRPLSRELVAKDRMK